MPWNISKLMPLAFALTLTLTLAACGAATAPESDSIDVVVQAQKKGGKKESELDKRLACVGWCIDQCGGIATQSGVDCALTCVNNFCDDAQAVVVGGDVQVATSPDMVLDPGPAPSQPGAQVAPLPVQVHTSP